MSGNSEQSEDFNKHIEQILQKIIDIAEAIHLIKTLFLENQSHQKIFNTNIQKRL